MLVSAIAFASIATFASAAFISLAGSAGFWHATSASTASEVITIRMVPLPVLTKGVTSQLWRPSPPWRLNQLDRDRRGLAAADAQRGDALGLALGLERADQRDDQPRAGGADRVAARSCAATDVD